MYEPAPSVFEELKKNMKPFNDTGNTAYLIKAAMGASNGKFPFFYARPDLTPEVRRVLVRCCLYNRVTPHSAVLYGMGLWAPIPLSRSRLPVTRIAC